jgi:hypothetical protein
VIDGPLAPISCVSQTAYERCTCPSVTDLAHALCLPPGVLKDKAAKLVEDRFAKNPKEKAKAEKILYPYLAASVLYATRWQWDPNVGLRKTKTG